MSAAELPPSQSSEGTKQRSLRHDFLTPMNHVLGYSEMLLEEATGDMVAALEEIHQNGKHLLALVTGLFDTSGALTGTADLGREIRALAEIIAGQGRSLLQGLSDEEREAIATDVRNIERALRNLVGLMDSVPHLVDPAASAPTSRTFTAAPLVPRAASPAAASPAPTVQTSAQHQYGPLLVVDDNEDNRDMLSRRLRRLGYTVHTAEDGHMALQMMEATRFDMVLLDVMMPGLDGYAVLQRMKSDDNLRGIPVIMISALQEIESIVRCITLGAEDYLPKPFDPVLLKARVGACLEKKRLHDQTVVHLRQIEQYNKHLKEMVREQVKDISKAQLGAIFALSKLAESRDSDTGTHLERVRAYCEILAKELRKTGKYPQLEDPIYLETLYAASPLHDIGKVGIPDSILLKAGKLTDEEFEIMRTHTLLGASTLRAADKEHPGNSFIQTGIEIAECHHEKWDGTGYPHGLAGDQIPLSARIIALADVYDALRAKRCYKEAFSHEKSAGIILASRGTHFDPDVVDAFVAKERDFDAVWDRLNDEEA